MDVENPYILGYAGQAAAGKTAAATMLAPSSQVFLKEDEDSLGIFWTKLSFATPLRKILSARQKITGENVFSRQAHQVHESLRELVGAFLEYDELVELTYEVCSFPVPTEGKPREFLQWLGTDALRAIHPDVFVRWMDRQVRLEFAAFRKEYPLEPPTCPNCEPDEEYIPPAFGVVIDDVRFENEVGWVLDQPNGYLVKLEVTPEEANRRLLERDGHGMTSEQMAHPSENRLHLVDSRSFAAIIDTDKCDVKGVVAQTLDAVFPRQAESDIINPLFDNLIQGIQ